MSKMIRKSRLAKLYGVHRTTLQRWFKLNPKLRHLVGGSQFVNSNDQKLIREILGDWEEPAAT